MTILSVSKGNFWCLFRIIPWSHFFSWPRWVACLFCTDFAERNAVEKETEREITPGLDLQFNTVMISYRESEWRHSNGGNFISAILNESSEKDIGG